MASLHSLSVKGTGENEKKTGAEMRKCSSSLAADKRTHDADQQMQVARKLS